MCTSTSDSFSAIADNVNPMDSSNDKAINKNFNVQKSSHGDAAVCEVSAFFNCLNLL